jgi:hypothetical protein
VINLLSKAQRLRWVIKSLALIFLHHTVIAITNDFHHLRDSNIKNIIRLAHATCFSLAFVAPLHASKAVTETFTVIQTQPVITHIDLGALGATLGPSVRSPQRVSRAVSTSTRSNF